jgi:hypothetical protein
MQAVELLHRTPHTRTWRLPAASGTVKSAVEAPHSKEGWRQAVLAPAAAGVTAAAAAAAAAAAKAAAVVVTVQAAEPRQRSPS